MTTTQLTLNEQQSLLQHSAQALFRERAPVTRLRALRDGRDADSGTGFSRKLWREMADLGWVGLCLPEAHGGLGLGMAELCVVLEQAGRQLAPEPWLSTVLLGAQALVLGGQPAQKQRFLSAVASGEALLSLAFEERTSRFDLSQISTTAEWHGATWRLSGEKLQVFDAHVADALIVLARTGPAQPKAAEAATNSFSLFLIERGARGLEIERHTRVDSRNAATVRFQAVDVAAEALIGNAGQGLALLSQVVDRATIGVSAEMLGSANQAFDDTLDYLKTRKQFGVTLGSFQALAHRASRLYIELALARSAVAAAASGADTAGPAELAKLASLAKARCSDVFVHVANEAVQMHGGIGVTDDFHIGLYLKRARAAEVLFGDSTQHLRRWAQLSGY
jgi:alkylation response protein AidB-like acyl-CoA dehydrogenase